jgi:hypothetical protein
VLLHIYFIICLWNFQKLDIPETSVGYWNHVSFVEYNLGNFLARDSVFRKGSMIFNIAGFCKEFLSFMHILLCSTRVCLCRMMHDTHNNTKRIGNWNNDLEWRQRLLIGFMIPPRLQLQKSTDCHESRRENILLQKKSRFRFQD